MVKNGPDCDLSPLGSRSSFNLQKSIDLLDIERISLFSKVVQHRGGAGAAADGGGSREEEVAEASTAEQHQQPWVAEEISPEPLPLSPSRSPPTGTIVGQPPDTRPLRPPRTRRARERLGSDSSDTTTSYGMLDVLRSLKSLLKISRVCVIFQYTQML